MRIHVLLGLALACHPASKPAAPSAPAVAATPAPAVAPTPAPAYAVAASPVHAAAVENLVGVWQGQAIGTPFGNFPFAIAFDRQPSGEIHGRLQTTPGTYLEFRFRRQHEQWVLIEEGSLTGEMQTHTLLPEVSAAARWSDTSPLRLTVELAVDQETLAWTTWMSGTEHAKFAMKRVRGPAADKVREAIARRLGKAAE